MNYSPPALLAANAALMGHVEGNFPPDLGADSPHGTSRGESPSSGEVPLWVTACILFDPPPVASSANTVSTAVAFLMASCVRVHGDLAVKLSPTRLALLCGFERPEKAKWLTDYLQRIGFLRILDGGVNPKTGRRQARRDAQGRPIENELLVFPSPPPNYRGPRTLAEIDAAIAEDIAEAEFAHERSAGTGTKRSKPRTIRIRKRDLFGPPAGQPIPPGRGMEFDTQPPAGGDGNVSAGQATFHSIPPGRGMEFDTQPPAGGDGNVSAGQATFHPIPPGGGSYRSDRSSISDREIEGSISMEPVPGGTAEPPATGMDEAWGEEVREAARSFPVKAWYAARGQTQGLSKGDTDRLKTAILAAMARTSLTLEQVRQIGQAAVSEAKKSPVTYAEQAFSAANLPKWLARITPEPEARIPLPLLDLAPEVTESTPAKRPAGRDAVVDQPAAPKAPVVRAAKCGTCRAPADALWNERLVPATNEPCPGCFPADQMWRFEKPDMSAQASS
ncbi:hypothetical protein ACFORH_43495 [Amycolatopsis roodepoortensis]|uniref:Uncharacterized protein n=1 Tax=Amycolatopsis roodepoortensis TaxID=700274 RepID=A0ABR9LJD2_9PSEU|nr:hypothetical protein [Amycolatopsis roodepoortensis]MBE1580390.1 hypothetical protein [Amycolatopsis roodepoortensis]